MLLLSIPLAAGIILTSSIGLFTGDFYWQETSNWGLQSWVQDMVNLFVVTPLLFISAIMSFKGNKSAFSVWGGVNLYLIYTFAIYCFDVHFNTLFLFYCINLGLSFYSMLFFITSLKKVETKVYPGHHGKKLISIYFIFIALVFCVLWLSEIVPFMEAGTTPLSLKETGLATNPVHVIDLAVFLPGVFVTGVLLWNNKYAGLIFTPVILTFLILMDITIGTINFIMYQMDMSASMLMTWVMASLAIVSILALIWFIAEFKYESDFGFDYRA